MATEPPPTHTPILEIDSTTGSGTFSPHWLRWFTDLSNRTGGVSGGGIGGSGSGPVVSTALQVETAVNYIVTGNFDLEVVVCINAAGVNITITMPMLGSAQVLVTRKGLGGVTIAGSGTNILGLANQTLPMQYDSAHMYGTTTEWVLQ